MRILVIVFVLFGCVTTRYYHRPDVTDEQANRDLANCQAKAGQACVGNTICFIQVERTCMRGEGYSLSH